MESISDARLRELQGRSDDLTRRHAEQQATVASIRRKLEQAREDDLNREALALSNKTDKPRPKAPSVARALQDAEHDAEVLGRALEMANGELYRYLAENTQALDAKLRDAKAARAREISELAAPLLASLRDFYQVDEDAKVLKPYRQQQTEFGDKPRDMVTILGVPHTTANVFGADRIGGMERGTLEGVIRSLADLGPQYEAASLEATSEGKGAA